MGYKRTEEGYQSLAPIPVVFNIYSFEALNLYLNLQKGFYKSIPFSHGIRFENVFDDTSRVFKQLYSFIMEKNPPFFNIRRDDEVREKLLIKDGLFYNSHNEIVTNVSDRVYVANSKVDLFVCKEKGSHHPDMLKGKYGVSAGHLSIENGKITFISNNSGHYLTHSLHLYNFVQLLMEKEVLHEKANIEDAGKVEEIYDGETLRRQSTKYAPAVYLETFDRETLEKEWQEELSTRIENNPFFKAILS